MARTNHKFNFLSHNEMLTSSGLKNHMHCSYRDLLSGCDDGDVRLVNGTTSLEGLVEICRNNDWGTAAACVGFWGSADASVVCRQLGFSPQGAEAFSQAAFGQHSFIVWLDTVHCVGTESRLVDCSADPVDSQDCLYWADAGVRCMLGMFFSGLFQNNSSALQVANFVGEEVEY